MQNIAKKNLKKYTQLVLFLAVFFFSCLSIVNKRMNYGRVGGLILEANLTSEVPENSTRKILADHLEDGHIHWSKKKHLHHNGIELIKVIQTP